MQFINTRGKFKELTEKIKKNVEGLSTAYQCIDHSIDSFGMESFDLRINENSYFVISNSSGGCVQINLLEHPQDHSLYSLIIQPHLIQFFSRREKMKFDSFEQLLNDYFTFPVNINERKKTISTQAKEILGENVSTSLIEYDLMTKSYFFTDWKEETGIENLFWEKHFTEKRETDKTTTFAKYMSFSTFIKTLESGKIRMNSIIGMNDKSELNFTDQFLYNKESVSVYNDETYESFYESNKRFITSFSTLIDDLNMWRLYGDDSAGVCLVFKYDETQPIPFLYPIYYTNEEGSPLQKAKSFIDTLKLKDIDFDFNSLRRLQNFFKSEDYSNENEYRLLMKNDNPSGWMVSGGNGILTPYIEKCFKKDPNSPNNSDSFPLYLTKVIFGSKMRAKEVNIYQLHEMRQYLGLPHFLVEISKEKTYR